MKLYHFTATHLVESVLATGLILGAIPSRHHSKVRLVPGFQWLTSESRFDLQRWATRHFTRADRTAYRLEVRIPAGERLALHRWVDVAQTLAGDFSHDLAEVGGAVDWWVFKGSIEPQWIAHVDAKAVAA